MLHNINKKQEQKEVKIKNKTFCEVLHRGSEGKVLTVDELKVIIGKER